MKFRGTYQQLQDLILLTGIYGEWCDLGNQKQYRTEDGAVLNWWQSSGTIYIQGKPDAARQLADALANVNVAVNQRCLRLPT